uniref:Uncharacterized protein n=1 Tax=Meloidogyne hapla TaxID=6305 RepID=A0A1I8BVT5_MELHA
MLRESFHIINKVRKIYCFFVQIEKEITKNECFSSSNIENNNDKNIIEEEINVDDKAKNIIDDDNKFIPLGIPLVNADEIQHITKDEAQQIEDINTKNFSKD